MGPRCARSSATNAMGLGAMPELYDHPGGLPADLLESCRPMPLPTRLLMCPPDHFDVSEVRNPHMESTIGSVDFDNATRQWEALRESFEACGATIDIINSTYGCEDMVFCANQSVAGLDGEGEPLCVMSQMKHAARQPEVPAFARWFESHGYRVEHLPGDEVMEGSGDAIWHPGRALIWGGHGLRTEPDAYDAISDFFEVPVLRLGLRSDRFYHLDTCFCALDEETALVFPPVIDEPGMDLIRSVFQNVIECNEQEAVEGMACNGTAIAGTHVLIDGVNPCTSERLRDLGYTVQEVDTSEFRKSGGSVFCMKQYVF